MKLLLLVLTVSIVLVPASAQTVEDWIESAEYPEELRDWLDYLKEHPLNLNRTTLHELALLPFFNEDAARLILHERDLRQQFETIDDVLALKSLTAAQQNSLRLFTMVQVSRAVNGAMQVRTTAGIVDHPSQPLRSEDWQAKTNAEFRTNIGTKGFLFGSRRSGTADFVDNVSAGIEIPAQEHVPRILAGDFQYEVGCGLVFASAYGIGNWLSAAESTEPTNVHGLVSRPTTNKLSQYRGFAVSQKTSVWKVSVLYSDHRLDAQLDSLGLVDRMAQYPSSSPEANEARKGQVREVLIGGNIEGRTQHLAYGITAYRARYSPSFATDSGSQSPYSLTGNRLDLGSFFTRGSYKGIAWLSELAGSRPGGFAYQASLGFGNRQFGSVLYHVKTDDDFVSPHSRIWGGLGGAAIQRTGFRLRSAWTKHSLSLDCQTERTPSSKTTYALSKNAYSLELRWQLKLLKKLRIELLGARKHGEQTTSTGPGHDYRLDRGRFETILQTVAEFKFRFEIRSWQDQNTNKNSLGTALYLQVKIPVYRFDVFGRITIYDMESSNVGMSVYETSLQGSSPVVSLAGSGRRLSVTVLRKWSFLSAGLKLAHTVSSNAANDREESEMALEISFHR